MTPPCGAGSPFSGAVGAARNPAASADGFAVIIYLDQLDTLDFPAIPVSDQNVPARAQLLLDELIQRDGAVDDICLGQARRFVQLLQVPPNPRNKAYRDPVWR